jgi:MFS family permease
MLTLKKGFLLSDDAALIFASMQLVGAIISSYANTLLLDRVGPRPIMIIYTSVVATICVLWIVLPISWIWTVGIAVFLLIGAANAGIQTSLSHYLLSSVAPEKVVSISMLMVIFSNTIAGLVGTRLDGLPGLFCSDFSLVVADHLGGFPAPTGGRSPGARRFGNLVFPARMAGALYPAKIVRVAEREQ